MSTNRPTVNPVHRFRALLPGGNRTYGKVLSVNATEKTSLIQLQNGDELRAKGSDYAVNARVLIVDGEIQQQVQDLPFTNITIF